LDRDYLLLLDFDLAVDFYEEQLVTIEYCDSRGSLRRYTPDVLVRYRRAVNAISVSLSVLCEVKYRDDLRQHWAEYKLKFKAAHCYARERAWRFRLITEREIRTPYLENVKFLRQYRDLAVDNAQQSQLLQTLAERPATEVGGLLAAMTEDRWRQAQLLPVLWHKVRDLTPMLTPRSNTLPVTDDPGLVTVSDDTWSIARARFAVIQPLLSVSRCTRAEVGDAPAPLASARPRCIAGYNAIIAAAASRRYFPPSVAAARAKAGSAQTSRQSFRRLSRRPT
jgi:hypothetical protein